MNKFFRSLTMAVTLLIVWQLIIWIFHLPDYFLPSPAQVFLELIHQAPVIFTQAKTTILETLLGLFFGVLFGGCAAIVVTIFKPLRLWVIPILVLSQAIPTFAIAPLLVLWLGYGIASKVATATIMIFFPIVTTLYDGLQQTSQIWLDIAKTMNASRWKILRYIQLPAAMPSFASGLRVAAAIAPIGAVVGEWVGSSSGLGYLMLNANARLDIPMMFAALFVLTMFTLILYFIVDRLLQRLIWWRQ